MALVAAAVGAVRQMPHGQIVVPHGLRVGLARGQAGLAVIEHEAGLGGGVQHRQADPGGKLAQGRIVVRQLVIEPGAVGRLEAQIEAGLAVQPAAWARLFSHAPCSRTSRGKPSCRPVTEAAGTTSRRR